MNASDLDDFTRAYIECALWSTCDEKEIPLDANFGPEDIAPDTLAKMAEDCRRFQEENAADLALRDSGAGGHDFWLTRNGHGAGFWDGDWPDDAGERLTQAAHAYGERYLYVADNSTIWQG